MIQEKLGIGSYGTVYKVIKKGTNDIPFLIFSIVPMNHFYFPED